MDFSIFHTLWVCLLKLFTITLCDITLHAIEPVESKCGCSGGTLSLRPILSRRAKSLREVQADKWNGSFKFDSTGTNPLLPVEA